MTTDELVQVIPLRTDESGTIRVGKTRVMLELVLSAFLTGSNAEEIVDQYPSLDLADVYYVLGYYISHRAAMDAYLQQQAVAVEEARKEANRRWDRTGMRERLLARRDKMAS